MNKWKCKICRFLHSDAWYRVVKIFAYLFYIYYVVTTIAISFEEPWYLVLTIPINAMLGYFMYKMVKIAGWW